MVKQPNQRPVLLPGPTPVAGPTSKAGATPTTEARELARELDTISRMLDAGELDVWDATGMLDDWLEEHYPQA